MRRTLLALVLSGSLVAAAQQVTTPSGAPAQNQNNSLQAQQPQPKGSVSGRVIDSDTGKALKKAVVTLRRNDKPDTRPQSAITDADGAFEIKDVEAGKYVASASRRGYARSGGQQRGVGTGPGVLTLNAGQKVDDVLLKLIPGAVLTGRAFDEDGEPLTGVQVSVLRNSYVNGKKQMLPSGFGSTDDRGEYRIFGLTPGSYFVRANYTGVAMFTMAANANDAAENLAYPAMFYPGTPEASQAAPLVFRRGDEQRVDFNFQPQHSFKIKGKVVGLTPGSRPFLMLAPGDSDAASGFMMMGPRNSAITNPDDTFEFPKVLPGNYTIVARGNEDNRQLVGRQSVDIREGDIDNLIIAVSPGAELPGKLTVEGDITRTRGFRISLQADDSIPMGGVGFAGAVVKEDFSFNITDILDGRYRLNVFGIPPEAYLKSARLGTEDVLEKGLLVSGTRKLPALDVVLSSRGAKLTGTVNDKDDKPQAAATVVLIPDDQPKGIPPLFKTSSTDQNGKFSLQGIRPGHYKLYAFEQIETGAFQDPEYMKKFSDSGHSFNLAENAQETITLKAIPAADVEQQ
jgi:protocatechuate 3,4-dioxygenase beta subunit